ncbi:MAG: M12 family metallo-peptidase [Alphaproteobacteria bacterium]|nr:M12 family metallo-peptidase [Alphaproteobacteria bacterium]
MSEPFTAVGALADTDLPPQAKAGSGRKLQRHGTRGFKSRRWAIDLPGRGRTVALRRQQRVSGDGRGVTWLGQVEGAQGGMVAITTRDGLINGFIDDGRRYWVIENAGQGLYKLFEIDTSQTPPPAAPLGQANEPGGESGAGGGTQAAGGTVIQDLLVAFTPEVTARYGGVTATVNAINNHVAAINQSYSNSQVNIQMNLVGTVELGQAQSGNMSTTLSRLRSTTDGYYDEVHPLRDELGADLVAMLTTETGYCGIAYLNHPQFSGEDRYAFSVTSAYSGYACLPLTLPHEIGHNQGLCHNREETGCTNPAYAYGYGYRVCGSFRTIMSYSCTGATRIYHIANPAVLYNGMPTGILHSVDPNNSSEASRALNDSAADVAAWRAGCAVVSAPAAPTLLAAAAASSTEIGLSWTDNASDETAFEVERSPDGTSWTKIATVGASGDTGNTVNFNDTGLAASTTYHYQVRAINCAGNSAYAGPASDTTQEPPPAPPAVPDGLVAVFDGLNTVNLTWNAATGADYYEVLRQEKTGKGKNAWDAMTTLETNIAGTSFDDTPVTAGATYRYYVRSWASDGQSSDVSAPLQVKLSGDTGGGGGGGGSGCTKGKKKNCGDS